MKIRHKKDRFLKHFLDKPLLYYYLNVVCEGVAFEH